MSYIILPVAEADKAYYQVAILMFFPYTAETKNVKVHRQ